VQDTTSFQLDAGKLYICILFARYTPWRKRFILVPWISVLELGEAQYIGFYGSILVDTVTPR